VDEENRAEALRTESWAGEIRINLIRLAALLAFYGHHLLNVYFFKLQDSRARYFHGSVTVLAWALGLMVLVLFVGLSRHWAPPWLKYAVVVLDTVFVSVLIAVAADPKSPLLLLYFLILASTPLRMSPRLVQAATILTILAYLCLLGYYIFVDIGWKEYSRNPSVKLGRGLEIFIVLGMASAGFFASQAVRQFRRLMESSPVAGGPSSKEPLA